MILPEPFELALKHLGKNRHATRIRRNLAIERVAGDLTAS
jgi:hypothetical protein